jgi:hypothetical protein
MEKALKSDMESLGPEHPSVATSRNNLAYVLKELGDSEGARSNWEEALRIWEKVLGPDHPHTMYVKNVLAGLDE